MALGAAPGRVLAQVLSQYLMLAAAGIATGLAIAWARSRFVGELLVAVSPTDVRVYAAVALLTLAAAALAALAPARRAAARAALRADWPAPPDGPAPRRGRRFAPTAGLRPDGDHAPVNPCTDEPVHP